MRKLIIFFLTVCVLILPGCAREDSQIQPTQSAEVLEQQVQQASANLKQNLKIDDAQLDDISVAQVQTYEDETIVRYVQTYRGVEIYGSSMVTTSTDEEYFGGTYYDLADAFGEDFDALVEEASTVPEWMHTVIYEDETLVFLPETLRAVIYITSDNCAVVAREFEIVLSDANVSYPFRVVTDVSGQICYTYDCLVSSYQTAEVKSGKRTMEVIRVGEKYYAYNEEHNYYVLYTDSYKGIEDKYIHNNGAELDLSLMYSSASAAWNNGRSKTIFDTMDVYNNVAAWYSETFSYRGIDGIGGTGILVVMDEFGDIAQNRGERGYLIVAGTTKGGIGVVQAPEILAHEYAHAVIRNICGLKTINEQAALHEGIADTFAALYMADGKWHIGAAVAADGGSERIIPDIRKTMDDYVYDNTDDYDISKKRNPTDLGSWDTIRFNISRGTTGVFDFDMDSSTAHAHENGEIISSTLHQVWERAFQKDDDAFSKVLYRSLHYLTCDSDFADFREAFLYAMRLSYPAEKVAAAQGCFSNAGIEQKKSGRIVTIQKQTAGSDEITLEDMMSLPYKDLKEMVWDEFHVSSSFDTPDTWGVQCSIGECYYTIYYYGYDFEDEDALPSQVSGQDFRKTGKKMAICDVIRTGMTYAEIAGAADVPEPYHSQVCWTTSFQMSCYFVRLFFEGDAEPGELYSAEISLDEYGINPDTANPDSEMNARYLLDYCRANYATISKELADSCYTWQDSYYEEAWYYTCNIGSVLELVFSFTSDYEDLAAMPYCVTINDSMYWTWSGSSSAAELLPGLVMGMTYAEASEVIELTSLDLAPAQSWTEPVYLAFAGDYGCSLELYFVGSSEDTAVLVSITAIPIG